MSSGVPAIELVVEHQIQFEVNVRSFPVDSDAGVTHDGDMLSTLHRVADVDVDFTEMPVQTVIRRTVPDVLDHNVLAVIRVAGDKTGVDNFSIRNRANFVPRLAVFIAIHRSDIDAFMKTRVDNSLPGRLGIADKSVLPAFPWI